MKYIDPYGGILKAFRNRYGEKDVVIYFSDKIRRRWFRGCWGYCDFSQDIPQIVISAWLSTHHAVEILAHELAHLVLGKDNMNHSGEWRRVFEEIHKEVIRLQQEVDSE